VGFSTFVNDDGLFGVILCLIDVDKIRGELHQSCRNNSWRGSCIRCNRELVVRIRSRCLDIDRGPSRITLVLSIDFNGSGKV
jgi:hypothetical protein